MKTILITGAGSGIGRSVALAFAKDPAWTSILVGRTSDKLDETARLMDVDRVRCLPADVSDQAQVQAVFRDITATHGRLDVLFNNAGVSIGNVPFEDISSEQWRYIASVNIDGMLYCAQEAFRLQKASGGGRIINNGSISSQRPRNGAAAYTMTKHAVAGMTKSIALEGREHDICCTQLDIGNAASDMTSKFEEGGELQAGGGRLLEDKIPAYCVADQIKTICEMPLAANVLHMTIMANRMPFVGRG